MKILVTAGPTREPIDPVRYLSNRSSGKMGYAIAEAAEAAGHEVCLISGPVALEAPSQIETVMIETAAELFSAVEDRIQRYDSAVFAAAVSDYRPVEVSDHKIKKSARQLSLALERTEDILGSARGRFQFRGILIGFAAESEDLIKNGRGKLEGKGCDLLVANDISRSDIGFDAELNEVVVLSRDGGIEYLTKSPKLEIARQIIERIEAIDRKG